MLAINYMRKGNIGDHTDLVNKFLEDLDFSCVSTDGFSANGITLRSQKFYEKKEGDKLLMAALFKTYEPLGNCGYNSSLELLGNDNSVNDVSKSFSKRTELYKTIIF